MTYVVPEGPRGAGRRVRELGGRGASLGTGSQSTTEDIVAGLDPITLEQSVSN